MRISTCIILRIFRIIAYFTFILKYADTRIIVNRYARIRPLHQRSVPRVVGQTTTAVRIAFCDRNATRAARNDE